MEEIKEQFENLLTDLVRSGGYLIINKSLIKKIGVFPAILLSNYFEKHKYFKEHSPKNEGWFFIHHKKIIDELGIKEYAITQAKKKLIKLELIEIERRGIPSKEWININFINFYKLMLGNNNKTLVPQKTAGLQPQKTAGHNNTKGNNTKGNNTKGNNKRRRLNYIVPPLLEDGTESDSIQFSNKTETIGDKNKPYLPIAHKLAYLITSKKNVKINGRKLNSWANDIRLIVTEDDICQDRIINALDWYTEHHMDGYVPVIESGSSLRKKFLRLESAIERSTSNGNKNKGSGFKGKRTVPYQKSKKV